MVQRLGSASVLVSLGVLDDKGRPCATPWYSLLSVEIVYTGFGMWGSGPRYGLVGTGLGRLSFYYRSLLWVGLQVLERCHLHRHCGGT